MKCLLWRFMRNTMQRHCRKKCITRFIIHVVQSHSGPPTSTPLNIFYIRACCPRHNENSCAYQRRKRHNCQYLSKFTTETSWKVYIYLHDCRSTGNSGIYAANSTYIQIAKTSVFYKWHTILREYEYDIFKTLPYNSNIILQIGAPECINNLCTCINDSSIKMHLKYSSAFLALVNDDITHLNSFWWLINYNLYNPQK